MLGDAGVARDIRGYLRVLVGTGGTGRYLEVYGMLGVLEGLWGAGWYWGMGGHRGYWANWDIERILHGFRGRGVVVVLD